jgi:DNA-nicking Smr family endonuclease
MAARRSRGLTEHDRALWRAYTVQTRVAPLPGRALEASAAAPAASAPPAPAPKSTRTAAPAHGGRPMRPAELHIGTPPGGLDTKRWRDLRRGRTRPERTLDLHGSRAHDAHLAVRRFLFEAQADGLRCIAIVTGKGSSLEGGVLRRELPHWLNAPELRGLLLGAAHPHAANPGAVHLLLRRAASRQGPNRA